MGEPIAKGEGWRIEHDWGAEFYFRESRIFCEPRWAALGNKLRKLAKLCELSDLARAATEAAEALEMRNA